MNDITQITPNVEALRRQVRSTLHAHWKLFLAQGILSEEQLPMCMKSQ